MEQYDEFIILTDEYGNKIGMGGVCKVDYGVELDIFDNDNNFVETISYKIKKINGVEVDKFSKE